MSDTARPVLVTGGAGFAGSYVVRALLDGGYSVVVFELADYRPEARDVLGDTDPIVFERGSIDDWPRVMEVFIAHRPGAVIHAGGVMDLRFLDEHPTVALGTNVAGTLNLLECSRLTDVDRFIFFSSIGVLGRCLYEPIDAQHPVISARDGPLGAYSSAKLAGEAFCFTHNQTFGLDTRIIRPSALYGFGMSWFAPNYMKTIVEPAALGQPVRLAHGGQVPRDYAHVVDLASLVVAVLEGPEDADRVFYAASGEPLRTAGEVGQIVRELIPDADIEISDEWSEGDRAETIIRGQLSIETARSQLGWTPAYADLRSGVAEYLERFRRFIERGGVPTPKPPHLEIYTGG